MDHEYEADLLTLLDDEGQQQEPDEIASDAETYYIFEVIEEDGEEQLQEVDDDALLDKLAGIFEERFNEAYFDGEEE